MVRGGYEGCLTPAVTGVPGKEASAQALVWTNHRAARTIVAHPDFHLYEVCNLYHDPAERFPNEIDNSLWAGPGMTKLIQEHLLLIQQYPNRELPTYYRDFEMFFDS